MKQLITIVLCGAALMLSACAGEDWEHTGLRRTEAQEGYGKFVLKTGEIVADVCDVTSRASLEDVPTFSDFTIELVENTTSQVTELKAGETECLLPVGEYTARASYGGDVMSATPYFYGEQPFSIASGEETAVSLTATLKSAVVRPVMTDELAAQFSTYTLQLSDGEQTLTATSGSDVFLPAGKSYTLSLTGTNKLDKEVNSTWTLNEVVAGTRYTVNCNADLPAFTLPEQAEVNAWSKFLYITPMTAANMTAHAEMADQVIADVVYEASTDGTTWIQSEKDGDKFVIKGLEPSTTYTVRSRFGGVESSNTTTLTTESAKEIPNGDMEEWWANQLHEQGTFMWIPAAWDMDIYCDYCTGWITHNERTTKGAEEANATASSKGNYGVKWRWCSNTIYTSSCTSGNYAAEISTMAFYNQRVNTGTIPDGPQSKVYTLVLENHIEFVGYLALGTYNAADDTYQLGIDHDARPVSISFDYAYSPVEGDNAIIYGKLYDEDWNELAETEAFTYLATESYASVKLSFNYMHLYTKAKYIGVLFQSGEDLNVNKMKHVQSDDGTPYKNDRVVGSVLKIDNVKLNYDYE